MSLLRQKETRQHSSILLQPRRYFQSSRPLSSHLRFGSLVFDDSSSPPWGITRLSSTTFFQRLSLPPSRFVPILEYHDSPVNKSTKNPSPSFRAIFRPLPHASSGTARSDTHSRPQNCSRFPLSNHSFTSTSHSHLARAWVVAWPEKKHPCSLVASLLETTQAPALTPGLLRIE